MLTSEHRTVDANGVALSVQTLGNPNAPTLLMLHGMQDVAQNLMPVASALAEHFHIVLPDLRGHGDSGWSDAYSFSAFVFDLLECLRQLELKRPLLFGHSLGGQILTRFAAMYPDQVKAMVIVEGLGPPAMPARSDPATAISMEATRLRSLMSAKPRPMPNIDVAIERFARNNPNLPPSQAAQLATNLTRPLHDGQLIWAFDPRVPIIFAAPEDSYRYWPHVRCPTLIVASELAHDYWRKIFPESKAWSGEFAAGELEQRVSLFARGELALLPGAGHMAHFDQPEQLALLTHNYFTGLSED